MITTSTPRPTTTTKTDPWDNDCWDDAEEAATSWVKTYEGGLKHRQYFGR
jgi:hypothetical protein